MSSTHAASSEPGPQPRMHPREQYEHSVDADDSDDDDEIYGVRVDVVPHTYGYEVRRGAESRPGVRSRPLR